VDDAILVLVRELADPDDDGDPRRGHRTGGMTAEMAEMVEMVGPMLRPRARCWASRRDA
jgi:hypothetical protein